MGVSPLFLGLFLEGGPVCETPSSHTIKRPLSSSPLKSNVLHAMFWGWCGLLVLIGASSVRVSWSDPSSVPPVAACWSIKRVCTRPWPSVRPVLRPRALTANKSWILDAFDACVGVCRVSGVHGLNVPSPLCPLTLILTMGFTYRAYTLAHFSFVVPLRCQHHHDHHHHHRHHAATPDHCR